MKCVMKITWFYYLHLLRSKSDNCIVQKYHEALKTKFLTKGRWIVLSIRVD